MEGSESIGILTVLSHEKLSLSDIIQDNFDLYGHNMTISGNAR